MSERPGAVADLDARCRVDVFVTAESDVMIAGSAGRTIIHKQVHTFTISDGQITRHRAVRDDLGLLQLGWRPRAGYLLQ